MVSRDASRRDMATQMSPKVVHIHLLAEGLLSLHLPADPSYSGAKRSSSPNMEVGDVHVDGKLHWSSIWSKKYGVGGRENGFGSVGEWKNRSARK
ncbi:hypothetical protein Scep_018842 [Stephania cephalantha]|uniref:Uncharacterized protein n=1 Tax=Stephania cephalantha TaxID=152367 RepID=A0AAP0NLL2_9MAGN